MSHPDRGAGLVLALLAMIVFAFVAAGLTTIVKVASREFNDRRARVRYQTSEAFVMMTAAMQAGDAMEMKLGERQTGGFVDLPAADVATELAQRLTESLASPQTQAGFPHSPIVAGSVSVTYAALPVASTDPLMDPFRSSTTLALTAAPFTLLVPPEGTANPFASLDYVPLGHPLAGMLVRRYPFNVTYDSVRPSGTVRVKRRISIYQVPVSQFARFSSAGLDASQANVNAAGVNTFAFGAVSGGAGISARRLWAAQVDTLAEEQYGSTVERAFNLSSVQLQASRMGGRLSGESWTLAAPHFFSARATGESITGTARPRPAPGEPSAKAYDAQTFVEVLFDPSRVSSADRLIGPVTLNVFDETGHKTTSVEGVMSGLGVGDAPAFAETLLDSSGREVGSRSSLLSTSASLPAPATEARAGLEMVAFRSGTWTFRVTSAAGDTIRLWIDDVLVATSTSSSSSVPVTLAAGIRRLRVDHIGNAGQVSAMVTPPGCPEAYLTQWSVGAGTALDRQGTFATDFLGRASFGWKIIPNGLLGNTTGEPIVAVSLNLDQPWLLGASGQDVAVYVEGTIPGQSRYFSAVGFEWPHVLVEVAGNTLSADVMARRSFSVLTPNPLVLTATVAPAYHGLYLLARGPNGETGNAVYWRYDQANAQDLAISGVVGGTRPEVVSFFDRTPLADSSFAAREAGRTETSPFFKTLVLLDDFFVQETAL